MSETAAVTDWVTLSELAKRAGRRHRAAQKAIESGRIPPSAVRRSATGRIKAVDAVAALSVWGADDAAGNRQAQRAVGDKVNARGDPEHRSTASQPSHSGTRHLPEGVADAYRVKAMADAKRAVISAKDAELDHQQRTGELVEAAVFRDRGFARWRLVRDRVLGKAAQIGHALAAEGDPVKCAAIVKAAYEELFTQLADDAAQEAATE